MSDAFVTLPGAAESQVILHVPHSSRRIPTHLRSGILLSDAALAFELLAMTDAHTDVIASHGAARADTAPWQFVNKISRLVVDPERFPDDREEMEAVGMGAVYTRTSTGGPLRTPSEQDRRSLLEAHFTPYSTALTELVQQRLDAANGVTVIDVHSYASRALPYEMHGEGPRPAICIGTDAQHTPSWLIEASQRSFSRFGDVGIDSPFRGTYVPLQHYGREPRVRSVMIEIRRDQYMDEHTGVADAEGLTLLGECLATLINCAQAPVHREVTPSVPTS